MRTEFSRLFLEFWFTVPFLLHMDHMIKDDERHIFGRKLKNNKEPINGMVFGPKKEKVGRNLLPKSILSCKSKSLPISPKSKSCFAS